MGAKTSKNIVADTMSEDDSQSYNLINVHTPTANMGVTVFFCLVGVVLLVRLYMYVARGRCTRPKTGPGGRRLPIRRDTAAVDMDGHTGHAMPAQGVAVLQGADAKNSYWTRETRHAGHAWRRLGRTTGTGGRGRLGAVRTWPVWAGVSMEDPGWRRLPLLRDREGGGH